MKSESTVAAHVPRCAVLVDLDGTLLESRLSIRDTLNRVLAEHRLAPFSADEMNRQIGRPLRDILSDRSQDATLVEALTHRYRAAYNETGWVTVQVIPGFVALLQSLRRDGIALACVTSKGQQETETLLLDLGLGDLFDAIVGDDDRRPLKPDPAPVLAACQAVQVAPACAIMLGDTSYDVRAARAAGASAIGVLWGIHAAPTLREAGADATVATVPELERALRRKLKALAHAQD